MWQWVKHIGIASVIVALSGCDGSVEPAQQDLVGRLLPEVALTSLTGEVLSTDHFRGKVVVLNIWATWCAPCRRELPSLSRLAELLDDEKFAVLGVSIDDDPLLVREYLQDKAIGLPVYMADGGASILQALGAVALPYTFVVAGDGRVVNSYAGERLWHTPEMVKYLVAIEQ
ncbi:MAG: alkyl hydroperoxide reductase/thiol specific antioxidant/Mal allergen [Halothiobacillaceae bacterium]|nr:MAG: alkyl hydroperoxide reductase/thiol specific antioxidant/Mal allergen [Halothiobacillaceae bacterium]